MTTDKEIRQKAVECVSNIISKCRETPCKHCTGFEDCKQIQQTQCPYPKEIWSYEHGFADGVEEGKRLAIKHAHWTPTGYTGYADGNPVWDVYTCSACGDEHYGESDTLTDFCPCCGARMDEEGETE